MDWSGREEGTKNIMATWRYFGNESKYKAKKVEVNGIKYDSKREQRRHDELLLMEQAGEIKDLKRQVKFVLIPAQREPDTVGPKGGRIKGKLIERECAYYADYTYIDTKTGELVVEDVKGYRDGQAYALFKIKRKLMLYVYDIRVKEV